MATYVWKNSQWVCKKTGRPMDKPFAGQVTAPAAIVPDLPDYRSPIDGRVVSGRAARREDLRRNNCVEIDPPARPRGFKNPRFAAKHGLPLNQE